MNPKFLVIDDDKDILGLMQAVLQSFGCEADVAGSGEEGLGRLGTEEQARQYDAIFLDLMLPGMHGFDVIQKIKAIDHAKNIPVIMLTCKGKGEEIMDGYSYGADYYIPKPFTRAEILYGINLFLGESDDEGARKIPVHELPEDDAEKGTEKQ